MSNAASIRGPRRVKPPPVEPERVAARAPAMPPPLPPPLPTVAAPAAFAQTIRRLSTPPPLPIQSLTTQASTSEGHAPVRIHVRPVAPAPHMSEMTQRALGTTVRIGRRDLVREAAPQAWRPFRGFIVGASLGAAIMMGFTASGSDRVRDVRAWVATSLRTMKSDGAAHGAAAAPANASAANAPSSMVVPVVDVPAAVAPKASPAVATSPAPAACATPHAANATPITNAIPSLDVMQLPKAKAVRPWKASRRAAPPPRVEAPPDESDAPERAGDDA